MGSIRRMTVVFAVALALGGPAHAQEFSFYPDARYDPRIPAARTVIGQDLGERFTPFHRMENYLRALADKSDRVRLTDYGETFEGRKLYLMILTSPENHARMAEIRSNLGRLSDPRRIQSEDELDRLVANTPVVVWLSYTVHGDEASGTEAALQFAYHLAAATDEATMQVLRDAIVILDPCQNPDGRERFVAFQNSIAGRNPNPHRAAAEHSQPWPGGRHNHYLFDLNRDWFALTQTETRGKVSAMTEWHPQVHADLHEMGSDSTYYFAPPMAPYHENVPAQMKTWWSTYGRGNAAAFDARGWPYFVRETFDAFYAGYGDSWPVFGGIVGMTYEQASSAGLVIRRSDQTELRLRDAVWHHFVASWATCATATRHRKEQLRDYYLMRKSAIEEGVSGPLRFYLIPPGPDPGRTAKLIGRLMKQGIEVLRARSPLLPVTLRELNGTEVKRTELPGGTFMLPLAQPLSRLARAILEQDAKLDPKFIREERARLDAGEESQFYDVTAWSLPLAMGVQTFSTSDDLRSAGDLISAPPAVTGSVSGGEARVAYLLRYDSNDAARALIDLLHHGYKVHVARKGFRLHEAEYPRGTLVLFTGLNPPSLHRFLREAVIRLPVQFQAVDDAYTEEGISLGSPNVVFIKSPRVGVIYDSPASPTSYGWIDYLLGEQYRFPFTSIRAADLPGVDMKDFDVLVFPNEESGGMGYRGALGEKGIEKLKRWIEAGGVFVGIKGGARFAAQQGVKISSIHEGEPKPEEEDEEEEGAEESVPQAEAGGAAKRRVSKPPKTAGPAAGEEPAGATGSSDDRPPLEETPGAMLRIRLDPHHFLSFGYGEETPVLVASKLLFHPSKEKRHNVGTYAAADRLRVSGFIWDHMRERLAGKLYLSDESSGEGRVILFADDPNFRGFWDSLNRLFLNALLFGPSLRR
ncbi:MAG: hypothetical protein HY650_08280 [Acidobacteria bacterium]|nr:hypothetical protein [Acidobacteriota bacterium]